MLFDKQNDLITAICEGTSKRFKNIPCKYFEKINKQCILLKKQSIDEYLEKCRYAFELLYNAIDKHLKYFKKIYKYLPIDDKEDVKYEKIIERLKHQKIDRGYNLAVWSKYIHKTAYMEIRDILYKKGLIPRGKKCGTCSRLSASRPFTCTIDGLVKRKADDICNNYQADIHKFISINHEDREFFMNEMIEKMQENIQDPVCESGNGKNKEDKLTGIMKILKQRPESEKIGSKKRKKFERQYDVFAYYCHQLSDGVPKGSIEKHLSDRYGINEKTVRRDIQEIKKYLQKKNVL